MINKNGLTENMATANPAPLGLLGFGMTTVLLNLSNIGLYDLNSMILAMGLFYGGLAQLIAGLMEWKKNNTFGLTAFASYGSFWLTLVALILIQKTGLSSATSNIAMAAYFIIWGIFTSLLFIATLKLNRALQFIFFTLAILFFMLATGEITGIIGITRVAGYEGIICGAAAIYAGAAQVINDTYGRTILSLG